MTTLTVSAYAGILIALPVLLYQVYAFVLPALKPTERRVVLPFLILVPVLFIAGRRLRATSSSSRRRLKFLLNFNQNEFNIQVRASDYYSFFILTLLALGLVFQVPMGILAVTRLGIVDPAAALPQPPLRLPDPRVVAMLLPGTDPVTMLIELVPLLVLFEFSLILARLVGTPAEPREHPRRSPSRPASPAS